MHPVRLGCIYHPSPSFWVSRGDRQIWKDTSPTGLCNCTVVGHVGLCTLLPHQIQVSELKKCLVLHPLTGQHLRHRQIVLNRNQNSCKFKYSNGFGCLAQGIKGKVAPTSTIHFILNTELLHGWFVAYRKIIILTWWRRCSLHVPNGRWWQVRLWWEYKFPFHQAEIIESLTKKHRFMPKAQFGIIDIKDDDYHYGMPLASLQSTWGCLVQAPSWSCAWVYPRKCCYILVDLCQNYKGSFMLHDRH